MMLRRILLAAFVLVAQADDLGGNHIGYMMALVKAKKAGVNPLDVASGAKPLDAVRAVLTEDEYVLITSDKDFQKGYRTTKAINKAARAGVDPHDVASGAKTRDELRAVVTAEEYDLITSRVRIQHGWRQAVRIVQKQRDQLAFS